MKLDMSDYIGDIIPHAKFNVPVPTWARLHMHEVVDPRVYFLFTPATFLLPHAPVQITPFDRFPCLYFKRRVSASSAFFDRKICVTEIGKSLIGNNFGCVKDRWP